MTIHAQTPARAARRQLFRDRVTEYLTDRGAQPDHADAYARAILDIADQLGFTLPAAIDDPPAARGRADTSGPGHRRFTAAREALALPHADDCTPEMRRQGMYAADCERCERLVAEQSEAIREHRTTSPANPPTP